MNAGVGCQGTVLSDPQVTGEGKNSQNPGASAEPRARPVGTGQHQALKQGGLVLCTHESGRRGASEERPRGRTAWSDTSQATEGKGFLNRG